MLLTIFYKSVN